MPSKLWNSIEILVSAITRKTSVPLALSDNPESIVPY